MTDQTAGGLVPTARSRLSIGVLRPGTAYAVALVLLVGMVGYRWGTEGGATTSLFTLAACLGTAALLTLITRRVMFSAVAVTSIALLVVLGSSIKHKKMNMVMHAYDRVFYLNSSSTGS